MKLRIECRLGQLCFNASFLPGRILAGAEDIQGSCLQPNQLYIVEDAFQPLSRFLGSVVFHPFANRYTEQEPQLLLRVEVDNVREGSWIGRYWTAVIWAKNDPPVVEWVWPQAPGAARFAPQGLSRAPGPPGPAGALPPRAPRPAAKFRGLDVTEDPALGLICVEDDELSVRLPGLIVRDVDAADVQDAPITIALTARPAGHVWAQGQLAPPGPTTEFNLTMYTGSTEVSADGMYYVLVPEAKGCETVSVEVSDNGYYGAGGPQTATTHVTIGIIAINHPPAIATPLRSLTVLTDEPPAYVNFTLSDDMHPWDYMEGALEVRARARPV